MRNFKKLIAVVVTLVMLLSVAAIGVSAETAPTISLVGMPSTGATVEGKYYDVQVKLADSANAVGGIEGVITFDAPLTLADVVLSDSFTAAGNTEENSIAASEGTVKFVGLASGDGVWFTLKFTVADTDDTSATVAFSSIKGANAEGTGYIEFDPSALNVSVVDNDIVAAGGAAIKLVDTLDAQDIMFEAIVSETALKAKYGENVQVKKIGAVMGISKALEGVELLAGIKASYPGAVVEASTEYDVAENFAINLKNMRAGLVGVKIVSRAYIVVNNGGDDFYIYSHNYHVDYNVDNGNARQSVLDVAKKAVLLAKKNGFADETYTGEGEFNGKGVHEIATGSIPYDTELLTFIFNYIKAADAAEKLVVSQ